ncbi:SGNH/GDSL hydrolase family protein [Paenibacillus soyae]|uniref:SGNH/GDSL hydrolase family protein n=1 Tax=Paenibacillus soyae TaxID=2969249 RepID=A0A9X2MWA9_9BACL|nr:SGNH/GDSL hydrolase family protein [Paenibacillus soyae]MCR2807524.1 SGNH/GDSL hydrolase family protein [Paenibacillus soyae]
MDDQSVTRLDKYDEHMRRSSVAEGQEGASDLIWHDPGSEPFRLSGFPWFRQDRRYRRLPLQPSEPIPEAVDWLANCTAGGQIRFMTDSDVVYIRATLKGSADMYHMAPAGQCGFDAYTGGFGEQLFAGTAVFAPRDTEYSALLHRDDRRRLRLVTIHFPLYQAVEEAAVGLRSGAVLQEPPPYAHDGKVIVYGTSITQGACASRPGMAYPNQLSRCVNLEFVNLGFSGSGKGEPEMARIIAQIDSPACLVLDYEANCGGLSSLQETLPVFIRTYRQTHPKVPILLLTRILPPGIDGDEELKRSLEERRSYQRTLAEELKRQGDDRLYFADGSTFLGSRYGDSTVDGIHPTDYGFVLMADAILPELRRCLGDGEGGT